MDIYRQELDKDDYIIATYYLESKTSLWDAAYNIAVGQSIGNPNVRNNWETDALIEDHCCKISGYNQQSMENRTSGHVRIGFPKKNIDMKEDGISQLLCFLMGGHLDIDSITACHLLDIELDGGLTPKYGISNIRTITGVYDKPLLGAIIKPKTGITPSQLLYMIQQLIDAGVNFIKEDEILGNPACCPFKDRLKLIQTYINRNNVIYCYCINSDYPYCIERAKMVAAEGGNGVHINVWNGLGVYKSLRELDLSLVIHFQKSGDQAFTSTKHNYAITWIVICQLAAFMGVDTIHAGMWGGYSDYDEENLAYTLKLLRSKNVLPALSCGMHPGIVNKITKMFGPDYIANVGGAIHGHPGGTYAGAKAMRQAIDGEFGDEYNQAIAKWGLV